MNDFERPLGLALAGGGSHGAWQAGALRALTDSGLRFDKLIGFSAGALTGAGYALGLEDELAQRWRSVDAHRVLRLALRLRPLSIFSGDSIWEAVEHTTDEDHVRQHLRCELTVVSLRVPELEYDYARFSPGGAAGWDGPLAAKLVASCAIPRIFPPVETAVNGSPRQRLVDGGMPGREWLRFDALAGCRSVIALQMTRPDEAERSFWLPWRRFDQAGRAVCYRQMASGIDSLLANPEPPAIFRLYPSRVLDFSQLSFRERTCVPAMEQGREDGARFLAQPEPFRVRSPIGAPSGDAGAEALR